MSYCKLLWLGVLIGLLGACAERSEETVPSSPVVATVNGEPITEDDVVFMLDRLFGDEPLRGTETGLHDKVLESLIASRAMVHAVLQELDADEVAYIERRVAAYREELLVQEYLQRHAVAQPVTGEMVRDYYERYPEEFGGQQLRRFELLRSPADLRDDLQQDLLAAVPRLSAETDWAAQAEAWRQQYRLEYQQGVSRPGLLHPTLDSALAQLAAGDTSPVIYVSGRMHLVRLAGIETVPPRPLAEVSGDIRRKLAPLQLREAVRDVSRQAREAAEVDIQ